MPFDSITDRTDASALIPEDVSMELLQGAEDASFVLDTFTRVPVSRKQKRFPVLSALPQVYWVNGDTGLKQTTEMAWKNKYLDVEELAAIVPMPDAVVDDADFDIWGSVKPALSTEIGRALDMAVAFGINAPSVFPDDMATSIAAAGNEVVADSLAAAGGLHNDLDEALGLLEEDGFEATDVEGSARFKGLMRRARNTQGDRIDSGANSSLTEYDGTPVRYDMKGVWKAVAAATAGGDNYPLALLYDRSQFVVGVRQDVTFKVFTEGVVQDNTGAIVYNLMQQDMSALRVVFRAGWQVANSLSYEGGTIEAERYPASSLVLTK